MGAVLRELVRRHFPAKVENVDWKIVTYSGKCDLEKRFWVTMRGWDWGNPFFVVLRDNDGGECLLLKERLAQAAVSTGKPFKIRIVYQELESWFLADCEAVCAAYPRSKISNLTAKYRDPDRLTNASDELLGATGDRKKVARAKAIAQYFEPARNLSHSFQVFFHTLQQHLG